MYAEVIIDIKNKQVNRSFDYIIPSYLEGIIAVGSRVYVPFGKQKRMGYVLKIKDTTEVVRELKEISDLIDYKPILNEEFMEMAKYISIHDFSFYSTSLDAMIPQALRMKYEKIVKWVTDSLDDSLKSHFKLKKEVSLSRIPKDLEPILFKEIKLGNLVIDTRIKRVRKDKYITYIHNNLLNQRPSSKKGIDLLNYLEEANQDLELSYLVNECGYSKSVIDTLEKNGFISLYKLEAEVEEDVKNYKDKEVSLNDMQKNVYASLKLNENKVYLLHGVTGSGKTELYMRWIKDAISLGKKALMLVPEISLTPQITAQLYARFKESIAVLHSRLTISEKYDEWKRILNGDVKIVVGARSAIFAPIKDLGIVIVDECHEASYKQSNNPKYNAIDLAKMRAKTYNCPLVLGSATPNAEDYYKALEGEYILLSLPLRANLKPLPKVSIVDLREELKNGNRTPISYELKNALIECYQNKEQSILFLNRRGYSSFVQCRSCGEVIKCPHCDVSLTYHGKTNTLKCHYCGYQMVNVSKCSKCGSDKIRYVGSGTEKLEEAVKKILPEARVLRLDTDCITKMSDYEESYHKFKNHEADILVGTQMVTKGLDFENVTLVGVANADIALHYPTFDANQVAFNLLEQVAGRAGRAKRDGKVIIQTYDPENYVIQAAKNHDYEGFYKKEILFRKAALMPPFSESIEIEVIGKNITKVKAEAFHIANALREVSKSSVILGPTEAFIFKKKDLYHYTIQVQAADDAVLDKISYIYPLYQNDKDITLSITRK